MTNKTPEDEARELEAKTWASEYWDDEAESSIEADALVLARVAGATGYLAGQAVGYARALEKLEEAFKAGQKSVGWRDAEMSRIDMTWETYKEKLTKGGA